MADEEKRFDEVRDRWVWDAFGAKVSEVPNVLYHYTDAAGLFGMLTNHSIWATDYRFLNDRTELAHTRALTRDLVQSLAGEESGGPSSDFYTQILRYQGFDPVGHAFVSSLTEEEDDLSQWRGYGREGRGFTVGFCGSTLHELTLPNASAFTLSKVQYDPRKQRSALEKALTQISQRLDQLSALEGENRADLADAAARAFDAVVENRAAVNKHPSFRAEKEWRLVTFVIGQSPLLKVRPSGDKLVRYLDSPLGATGLLPIKRIGVGPGFAGTEEILAVRQLCEDNKYDVDIYFADTPYRRV